MFASSCKKGDESSNPASSETVTDIDGNIYKTVTIGTQIWMAENLKTTKYNDGTAIQLVTDNTVWKNSASPAYCWYKNDEGTYKNTYGALYNWYAVSTGKLSPSGWHVPSDSEWTTLISFLGGDAVSGGKLKEMGTAHWLSPNSGATNENGFSALPGGCKVTDSRLFVGIGEAGFFWSCISAQNAMAWYRQILYDTTTSMQINEFKTTGQSVRCVKD